MALPRAALRRRSLPADGIELSPIKEVELRASRTPGVISLAQGIPSFDTPVSIKRFAQQMLEEGMCARYSVSPGLPRLREAIALALQREGMRYDPEGEVLVTVGSIEAIAATLLASLSAGDEVLVVSPTYASYLPAIRIAGGVPRFVPLDEDAHFDLDPDAIAMAVGRRTRALLICNPNNPTGTVFSEEQTRRMLAVAERHGLLVITDEVYKDFVYGDARIYSAACEPGARDRVVRVCSFSKAFGMTGWRVGFLHGAARRVREILSVHDALVTCAPVISQYAALAALESEEEIVGEFRAEFRRRRDRVIERLDGLSHVFDYQKPNASYFAFPRVKDTVPHARDSRRLATDILERARVALVPGVAFGPTGESHLRLCYARPAEDVEEAFDRLEDYFAGRPPRVISIGPRPDRAAAPRSPVRRLAVGVLRRLARAYLLRYRPRVVAIAGDVGKTVIKRAVHDMLARERRVRANPLSYNTEIGLPLSVLGCGAQRHRARSIVLLDAVRRLFHDAAPPEVLVLELGVRRRGDMRSHLDIVRPDIVILSPLTASFHNDDSLAVMRDEVAELTREAAGRYVVCVDDPLLADLATRLPEAIRLSCADVSGTPGALEVRTNGARYGCGWDVVGTSGRLALLASVSVARLLGIGDDTIRATLRAPQA